MLEGYISRQIEEITKYFEETGYRVVKTNSMSMEIRPLEEGSIFRCSDDRYNSSDPTLEGCLAAPAFFGGTEGYAALLGGDVSNAYQWAADGVRQMGFQPGNHVAEPHSVPDSLPVRLRGIYGCAFVAGWIDGKFSSFCSVTAEEIADLRQKHGVKTVNLIGAHQADTLLLNFRPGETVVGNRQYFTVDASPLAWLRIPAETWVPLVADVGKMVLPENQPPKVGILV